MNCKRRFTTLETSTFQVVKRSGVVETFSREKVIAGVRRACQGRPVSDDDLAMLAQQVEEELRSTGVSNVSTDEVGRAILPFLRQLDEVAYLRFASVYRQFQSIEDFAAAIDELRAEDANGAGAAGDGGKAAATGKSVGKDVAAGSDEPEAEPAKPKRARRARKPRATASAAEVTDTLPGT